LDALCVRFIRDWLEMPVSACVSEVLELPKSQGGLGIKTFKHLAEKMSLVRRYALKNSASDDVRQAWSDTSRVGLGRRDTRRFPVSGRPPKK